MNNLEAAQTGDRRKALETARDTVAEALDRAIAADAGTVAQLVAQYRNTLADIAALDGDVEEEGSKLDAIVLKLADGNASGGRASADRSRTAGRRKPRAG